MWSGHSQASCYRVGRYVARRLHFPTAQSRPQAPKSTHLTAMLAECSPIATPATVRPETKRCPAIALDYPMCVYPDWWKGIYIPASTGLGPHQLY